MEFGLKLKPSTGTMTYYFGIMCMEYVRFPRRDAFIPNLINYLII